MHSCFLLPGMLLHCDNYVILRTSHYAPITPYKAYLYKPMLVHF